MKLHIALLSLALAGRGAAVAAPPSNDPWVVGYYAGYQSWLLAVKDIDWSDVTHIALAAALPKADGTLDTAFFIDATSGPALARELTSAAHAKGRKAIMMVGGAGAEEWAGAMSPSNLDTFVENLIATTKSLGFDGVDLDYEPSVRDLPTLVKLAKALRAASPSLLITTDMGWINPAFETVDPSWVAMAPYLDRLTIMSFEMAGPWEGWKSWHFSALTGSDIGAGRPTAVDVSVDAYIKAGVPAAKLNVGAGFYGNCWKGTVTGPRQPLGASTIVAGDNIMSYAAIMRDYYKAASYTYDAAAQAPYLSFPSGGGPLKCNFITYEDETSLRAKGKYVKTKGLGGVTAWTINQGYVPATRKNPPMKALMQGVTGSR